MEPDLKTLGFKLKDVHCLHWSVPSTPPWILKCPTIDLNLQGFCKEDTSPEIYRSKFYELCDKYKGFSQLYTDGSKVGDRVASAVVFRNTTNTCRLPDKAGIFRAELYAITLAMTLIRCTKESNFLILSDSLSSLQALRETKFECDQVYKIVKDYSNITGTSKNITLACIPSHVGITGNEKAKSALSLPVTNSTSIAYDEQHRI